MTARLVRDARTGAVLNNDADGAAAARAARAAAKKRRAVEDRLDALERRVLELEERASRG